ncbi:hypothetical protein MBH78_04225 [Oceanimonas sp. NS1]|uniref:Transporter n=1 Tax=Oceanimonas doudoroffii TaxID=84158 RepID=A0A233RC45_9GAMM|nr:MULTISPECIES: transporter [Oceanimonas]MCT7654221.1 hypothetical protein [Oceanimonas sp. NS1]NHI01027.1 hypothetical protein [Oceanimonas sp. MB9]OXY80941.1 hypothetical protein B6S08_14525 [Oceanimonas doudoroffii]
MKKGIFFTGLLFSLAIPVHAQDKQVVDSIANTLETRGLLTPKGTFEIEPAVSYSQNTSNRISILGFTQVPAFLVGIIELEDADQATFTTSLAARYGLTERIELELRVPWVYRYDTFRKRVGNGQASEAPRTFTSKGGALGDIEGAIRYQFNLESAPFWIGGVRIKSDTGESPFDNELDENDIFRDPPTGSGTWSIEPSMTLIYPTDPAVLFGTAGYSWNLGDDAGRDLDDDGEANDKFNLGNSFFLGMGMGFAVNNRLSFSLGVNHRTVFKPSINGRKVGEVLQLDSLSTGFSLALTEKSSLNLNLQAGLTEDAPDVEVSFSLPITF